MSNSNNTIGSSSQPQETSGEEIIKHRRDDTWYQVTVLLSEKKTITVENQDNIWMSYVQDQMNNPELSESERAYYARIFRVKSMPTLTKVKGNPVNMIFERMSQAWYFTDFKIIDIPEIVDEYTTFDLFNFPDDHVARRPSDSYFIKKSELKNQSMLLRPHTSVMWKYVMDDLWGIFELEQGWKLEYLSTGKVYRVDDIDPTHHECFHQIDGLKVTNKDIELITQDTLRELLTNIIYSIFGKDVEYRFLEDSFPYTQESLQVEVKFEQKWLEILWAWIVHPSVMESLWLDATKYNGWAFGFWIERLAMAIKKIPDIRLFWSQDPRVIKQWGNLNPFEQISNFPPVYKDISFIVPKSSFKKDEKESEISGDWELEDEADLFAIAALVRDMGWDMVEAVKIIDEFQNDKKFWDHKKSISIKITFRSLERTLTNEEINKIYFSIRERIETELGYSLR